MIVSFLYPSDHADHKIDMVFKPDPGNMKEPAYHASIMQLSIIENLSGIIIPGAQMDGDLINYDPIYFLKHIRLFDDPRISALPVYMPNTPESVYEKISKVLATGLELSFDQSFDLLEEGVDLKDLEEIRNAIGKKFDAISRHNLSNEWGAYRLSRQMSQFGIENEKFSSIKSKLSEELYVKKLLWKESKEKPFEINENQKTQFKSELYKIKNGVKNIAIIDDMIYKGWDKAYSKIFEDAKLSLFDQEQKVFDVRESINYDLIILDLRLREDSRHDASDILEVESLSGMQILKDIKASNPTVPVIISTASNKSWSVRSAMNNGADGFWTKEDPKRSLSFEYRFQNTFDLINVINTSIEWASKYRSLFEMFDDIEDAISNNQYVKELFKTRKNCSFHSCHC